jgi:hypothetical protein
MSQPVSFKVAERTRRRALLLVVGKLALLIVMGSMWAIQWDTAVAGPTTANALQDTDHASSEFPLDSQSYKAVQNADDHHAEEEAHADSEEHEHTDSDISDHAEENAPTDADDHHAADEEGDHDAEEEAHADSEEHEHTDSDISDHGDESALAHADDSHEHSKGDGHGSTVDVSPLTKQIVLGGFVGINAFAILIAGIRRRLNPPKLPKHLQG